MSAESNVHLRRTGGVDAGRDRRDAEIRAYHRRGYNAGLIARLVGMSRWGVRKAQIRMEHDGVVPAGYWD